MLPDLITGKATKWLMGGCARQRDDSHPGWHRTGRWGISSHYSEQHVIGNVWIFSGIFHLIFLDCIWLQVTETMDSETRVKGGPLYCPYTVSSGTWILTKLFSCYGFPTAMVLSVSEVRKRSCGWAVLGGPPAILNHAIAPARMAVLSSNASPTCTSNQLWLLLQCTFWFSRTRVGPKILHFSKAPRWFWSGDPTWSG